MSIFTLLFLLLGIGFITFIVLEVLDEMYRTRFIILMILVSLVIISSFTDHYFNKRQKIIVITDLDLCLEQDNKTGLKEIKKCNKYEDVYYLGNNVMLRNIK